jgi:hypothetical protein
MSVDQFLHLMTENPELRQRLVDADSNEDRRAMVAEYGIELPTMDAVAARIAELEEMSAVDGGHNWRGGPYITGSSSSTMIVGPT